MRARFAEYNRPLAAAPDHDRLRRRVELLSEVVFVVDARGLIVFMSSASIAMLRLETSQPRKLHVRMPRVDGSEVRVLISLTPIDSGGAVGVLYDFTAEQQATDEFDRLRYCARLLPRETDACRSVHGLEN
jgi:hypothetical protein